MCIDSFGWVTGNVSGIEEKGGGEGADVRFICVSFFG